jgi:hypothetical protein
MFYFRLFHAELYNPILLEVVDKICISKRKRRIDANESRGAVSEFSWKELFCKIILFRFQTSYTDDFFSHYFFKGRW